MNIEFFVAGNAGSGRKNFNGRRRTKSHFSRSADRGPENSERAETTLERQRSNTPHTRLRSHTFVLAIHTGPSLNGRLENTEIGFLKIRQIVYLTLCVCVAGLRKLAMYKKKIKYPQQ